MAADAKQDLPPSSGVDALIARLREEGVSAGRSDAEKIVADAKAKAQQILDKADKEAKEHIEAARAEAASYQSAGEQAIKTAMRDCVLDLKSQLAGRVSRDVKRLVSDNLKQEDLLKQMILELVGRAREDAKLDAAERVEVVLPEKAAGLEELRRNPAELKEGSATKFVLGLSEEMIRQGVTFSASDDIKAGVHIRIADGEVTVDLSDKAVADLLLQHLQPRFRAVLEGIVK